MFRILYIVLFEFFLSSVVSSANATKLCPFKEQTNGTYSLGNRTHTPCYPTKLGVYDSQGFKVMVLKGASHRYWLHQFRLEHYLFWLKPKFFTNDDSTYGIFVTDLRNEKTDIVLKGIDIVDYQVSPNAKKLAIFTTTDFSILDTASKKSQIYMKHTEVLPRTHVFERRGLGILGWSNDNRDVWFYIDDRSPVFKFYRWRADKVEHFGFLKELYIPGEDLIYYDEYRGVVRRHQLFNPTRGWVLHFKETETDKRGNYKLFLTDLVREKTVDVGLSKPGSPYELHPKWTGETTFSYKKENGDIAKGDALALLGLPKKDEAPKVRFGMIVAITAGVVILILLTSIVTLRLRRRRNTR